MFDGKFVSGKKGSNRFGYLDSIRWIDNKFGFDTIKEFVTDFSVLFQCYDIHYQPFQNIVPCLTFKL